MRLGWIPKVTASDRLDRLGAFEQALPGSDGLALALVATATSTHSSVPFSATRPPPSPGQRVRRRAAGVPAVGVPRHGGPQIGRSAAGGALAPAGRPADAAVLGSPRYAGAGSRRA